MIARLGEKVRRLRERAGWSQEELANQLGFASRASVSEIEQGVRLPSVERVLQLARLFGVSTDYLLKDEVTDPDSTG